MQKNKKYSVKFIASIIWAAFLIFFWNETYLLLSSTYETFQQLETPFSINLIAYVCWCFAFFIPAVNIFSDIIKPYMVRSTDKKSKILFLKETIYGILSRSIWSGLRTLIIPMTGVVIISLISSIFGAEYFIQKLNLPKDIMITTTKYIINSIHNFKDNQFLYCIVVGFPLSYAFAVPWMILIFTAFTMSFPLITLIWILMEIMNNLWHRQQAWKWYHKLDLESDRELISLTPEEIVSLGGIDQVKNDLDIIRKIHKPHKR